MMITWRGEVHVWPHSTGRGKSVDEEAVGGRVRTIEVKAETIEQALNLVQLYREGIRTNPMVWQAPIFKVERISP